MPTVVLATPLARFLPAAPGGERSFLVAATTVREAIEALLAEVPVLRGYLLDDHGGLRHHLTAFVDGVVVRDKQGLTEPIPEGGELYLVPALSGG